jgi:hypothetical protein
MSFSEHKSGLCDFPPLRGEGQVWQRASLSRTRPQGTDAARAETARERASFEMRSPDGAGSYSSPL